MQVESTIKETKKVIKNWKQAGESIGFVATMGYLHEGHTSLMEEARKNNDKLVVSIFINPMQFGPNEDLDSYPIDLERDKQICKDMGTDLIFTPSPEIMYPSGFSTFVDMSGLTEELCGIGRPGHFRGVCTVVNKLFNIIQPDRTYFGQKDAQQLAIIKRMVEDLNMDVEVIGCPIVREADGLAKSSRNTYLSPEERKAALAISEAIFLGERLVAEGETDASNVIAAMKKKLSSEARIQIEYVKVVDNRSMQEVETIKSDTLVAVAVHIGKTRLIDNFIVS